MKKKVILGFSGGLDTCFCVKYLKEKGYAVTTLTADTGGFSPEELEEIKKKSIKLGARKHISLDVREEFYARMITYLIKANGLYEEEYPNNTLDRYIISEKLIETARKEGADLVAHGSTGQGNDQVRFDAAILALAPDLSIIAPIRSLGITRPEEHKYLEKHGFKMESAYKRYTINQNIFGYTFSGSEIDDYKEPEESIFILTRITKKEPVYISIEFRKGLPVKMDGKELSGIEMLQSLNALAGSHGFGRKLVVNNTIIGIKGRILFEAPGILALINAHKALEKGVLTKAQYDFKQYLGAKWANLVYSGRYYDLLVQDLHAFLDHNQKRVSGNVKLKFHHGACMPIAISSPYLLEKKEIATYAQKASWSGKDATGFIKLYTLQQKIARMKDEKTS